MFKSLVSAILSFFMLVLSFLIRLCDMTNYRHIRLIKAPPLLTFSIVFFLVPEDLTLNIVFILAIRVWTLIQRIIRMLFFRVCGNTKGIILSVLFTKYVMRMSWSFFAVVIPKFISCIIFSSRFFLSCYFNQLLYIIIAWNGGFLFAFPFALKAVKKVCKDFFNRKYKHSCK